MESMEIHTPPQFPLSILTASLICLLSGCDDGGGEITPSSPADAGVSVCDQPLAEAHGVAVFRCPDGTRLGLRFESGVEVNGVGPALELDGRLHPPTDWPEALWRTNGDTVEGKFPAAGALPAMVYRARLGPQRVDLTVEIPPGDDVAFDGVDVVYAKGDEMGARLLGSAPEEWAAFPKDDGPFIAPRTGADRPLEQLVFGEDSALHIGPMKPGGGLTIGLDADARPDSVGLRATLRVPSRVVAPNAFSLTVELRAGPRPEPLLADYASSRVGPERRQTAGWGWRSGPRFGDRADLVLVSTQAAALSVNVAPYPHIIIDGRWYRSLGAWRPNEGFSDGFAQVVEIISPARFGLRWPLLHAEPASGVAEAHPDWIIEGDCPRAPCTLVNPRLPAVQETLRGEANRLFDQGVSLVIVSGLDALADPRGRQRVPDILPTYSQAGLEADSSVALAGGRTAFAAIPGLVGACAAATTEDDCPGRPSDADALRHQAHGLATRWHHNALAPLDPGPVHVDGLPRGIARQWAAIGALGGGWYLLGDDATNIEPGARETFFQPLDAGAVNAAQPRFQLGDDPPSVWMSDTTLAVFNWTDTPKTWRVSADAADAFDTMRDVFDPEQVHSMDVGDVFEIPPDDVLFFIRQDPPD